ncbi:uncharacterized protein Tco025E_05214 [Trypanosoma conorhini]|uniref:Uncharacterized protein n=1 Tax=Trypanosoma conorhini TaxID=83891 RepID=A0A3S5IT11_9TRYP|nr:uncharacterized protein Tco025E_05214 [Trypanosoma conorhini]RNF16384.1 hypothetical protein Tco025E_05214 [Trypanosoma conorhini]
MCAELPVRNGGVGRHVEEDREKTETQQQQQQQQRRRKRSAFSPRTQEHATSRTTSKTLRQYTSVACDNEHTRNTRLPAARVDVLLLVFLSSFLSVLILLLLRRFQSPCRVLGVSAKPPAAAAAGGAPCRRACETSVAATSLPSLRPARSTEGAKTMQETPECDFSTGASCSREARWRTFSAAAYVTAAGPHATSSTHAAFASRRVRNRSSSACPSAVPTASTSS